MGKIEDMQRQREVRFAEREERAAKAAKAEKAAPKPVHVAIEAAPAPAPASAEEPPQPTKPAAKAKGDVEEGKCPECGKVKPVQNGVMASHQKGFGKVCAGTRRKPA